MPIEDSTIPQKMVSGSLAGCIEVLVNHPLWTIKNIIQTGEPFTLNPRILYCGLLPNVASMVPITATQVTAKHVFNNMLFSGSENNASLQNVITAFSAGAFAATIACPVEMVMTNMMGTKINFISMTKTLIHQGGIGRLYSGFAMTAMRDGFFGVGYMTAPTILKPMCRSYVKTDEQADLLSKIIAGVSAAVASQAFDTIKTGQQTAKNKLGFFDAVKLPYAKHGVTGFFKGGLPRGARVASAIYVLSSVTDYMDTFFKQKNNPANNHSDNTQNTPKHDRSH